MFKQKLYVQPSKTLHIIEFWMAGQKSQLAGWF